VIKERRMPEESDAAFPSQVDVLPLLFALLDTLGAIARRLYPYSLGELVATLADQDENLRSVVQTSAPVGDPGCVEAQILQTSTFALRACDDLREAVNSVNPIGGAYRALRNYSRALETLTGLETIPAVGRYLLEPEFRDDPARLELLAAPRNPDTGVFHFSNQTSERGGFSVYVPPWYESAHRHPVVMALHGGSGHGRLFLWNWVPEARTRRLVVVAPTAIGDTWSLMEPEIDSANLSNILTRVRARWNVDTGRMLLTGMSDGGTFTMVSGLDAGSPFSHLAPIAATFHPLLLSMTDPNRITGLPIYLIHGARDWMFPVHVARTAHRVLAAAGAAIIYREVPDLSHAYPRDEQGAILDWLRVPANQSLTQ
jgi:phospholipase/carboxylesterase